MQYRVRVPFTINGQRVGRGTTLGPEIEEKKNFHALLGDGYIERKADAITGDKHVDGCYIVLQGFTGRGEKYRPGSFLDLRNESWKNEVQLVRSGYLKHATESDVKDHEGLDPSTLTLSRSGTAGPPTRPPIKLWKDEVWLRTRYIKEKRSIPEMEREAGCSRSTLWNALKKAGIKTRPRGRPKGT